MSCMRSSSPIGSAPGSVTTSNIQHPSPASSIQRERRLRHSLLHPVAVKGQLWGVNAAVDTDGLIAGDDVDEIEWSSVRRDRAPGGQVGRRLDDVAQTCPAVQRELNPSVRKPFQTGKA